MLQNSPNSSYLYILNYILELDLLVQKSISISMEIMLNI